MKLTATYPLPTSGAHIPHYRYFFNGQEADNEVYGKGVSLTAEFWQYDTRLGRRWNVDKKINHQISTYTCFNDNPISFNDFFGDTVRFHSFKERKDVFFARLFSKEFRKEYASLQKSTKIYSYQRIDNGGNITVEDATATGYPTKYTIHYSRISNDFYGRAPLHALFEETFHAVDFELKRSSSQIFFDEISGSYRIGHKSSDKSHEARAWQFAALNAPFYNKRPLITTENGIKVYVYNSLISQIRNLPTQNDIQSIETLLYGSFTSYLRLMNQTVKTAIKTPNLYK